MRRLLIPFVLPWVIACDPLAEADDPPIIIVPSDGAVADADEPDVELTDQGPPPDRGPPPDVGPPPDMGPACVDPCDDGDPTTTNDRCADDVCVGEALPALIALAGDAPLATAERPPPTAPLLRVDFEAADVFDEGLVPRGVASFADGGPWVTRPLAGHGLTSVQRWRGDAFVEVAQLPLVPGGRVHAAPDGGYVVAGDAPGPVVHAAPDGATTVFGLGVADGSGFVGVIDEAVVAAAITDGPEAPWVVDGLDAADPEALAGARVVGGFGFVPRGAELVVVDLERREAATVEFDADFVVDGSRVAERAGRRTMDLAAWPPAVRATDVEWTDARWLDRGLVALDAAGEVWSIAEGEDPVGLGRLALPAGFVAVRPDGQGALAREGDGWTFVRGSGPPAALPGDDQADRVFAGFHGTDAVFVEPDRVIALATENGPENTQFPGVTGDVVGFRDGVLWLRALEPAPMVLGRLDLDGFTPLSTVWTPDARTVEDDVQWVRTGGEMAAFVAETDGPLVALDLTDAAAEPVPVGRLRFGTRWATGAVTGDGRWALWRAGDEVAGSLRAGRTDGSHFPDGVEVLRSRAYPVLPAPTGALVALAVDPLPSGGFPVIDLSGDAPAEPQWVVVEGAGVSPLAWLDRDSLLVRMCVGEDRCQAWGIGRVDVVGGQPAFSPLVNAEGRMVRPDWGTTVTVVGGQVWFTRVVDLVGRQLVRVPVDAVGPWSVVASGRVPLDLYGGVAGRLWYALGDGGELPHHALVGVAGDPEPLVVPGSLQWALAGGVAPLGLFDEGPVPGCDPCRARTLATDGGPGQAIGGEAHLRPMMLAPAGDVAVLTELVDGRLELVLGGVGGPAVGLPRVDGADLHVLGWAP